MIKDIAARRWIIISLEGLFGILIGLLLVVCSVVALIILALAAAQAKSRSGDASSRHWTSGAKLGALVCLIIGVVLWQAPSWWLWGGEAFDVAAVLIGLVTPFVGIAVAVAWNKRNS